MLRPTFDNGNIRTNLGADVNCKLCTGNGYLINDKNIEVNCVCTGRADKETIMEIYLYYPKCIDFIPNINKINNG